jgi:putative ATPase
MSELGYGQDYRYAHDELEGISQGQTYFPKALGEQSYYQPTDRGLEIKIAAKLRKIRGEL